MASIVKYLVTPIPSWLVGNGVFWPMAKSTSSQNRPCGSQVVKMTATGPSFEPFTRNLGAEVDFRPPN
jgi:hypothetical protein